MPFVVLLLYLPFKDGLIQFFRPRVMSLKIKIHPEEAVLIEGCVKNQNVGKHLSDITKLTLQ